MTDAFTYEMPGRPVPWQRARSKGRQRWTPPAMRRAQRGHHVHALAARGLGWPLDGRYELDVVAYCHPRQRGDADNYAKLVADALQGAAYTNDRQLVRVVGERRVDAARPRTEVTIRITSGRPAHA